MRKLREKLCKIPAVNRIFMFVRALTADNVSVYAAQASFFLIISVIPLLTLIFTLIKMFINIDKQTILHTINAFAPSQVSGLFTTVINELFSKTSSVSIISVTAVSTLWAASKGIMALYTGLSRVYHTPMRNYFYSRLTSIIYTLAFIAMLILTILFFGFGNRLEHFLTGRFAFLSVIINFLLRGKFLIFMICLTMIFALFYTYIPKFENRRFKEQLPGAAFAAAGWMGFSYIYSIYIENFSNYSYVYGSLAAVVLLMLWLYICMNIFLYGAQINKMIKNGFFKK